MKKLTLLLVVFLSTSVLFAQNKVAKPMAEAPPILTNKIEAPVGTLNLHNSETPTINSVQLKKNKELAATMEIPSDSPELQKANLEMNNRLKQNEAKSIAAKAERDNYSEAIKKRFEKSQNNIAVQNKKNADLEKERIVLEQKRAEARKLAMKNYVAPSSEELASKKSNK